MPEIITIPPWVFYVLYIAAIWGAGLGVGYLVLKIEELRERKEKKLKEEYDSRIEKQKQKGREEQEQKEQEYASRVEQRRKEKEQKEQEEKLKEEQELKELFPPQWLLAYKTCEAMGSLRLIWVKEWLSRENNLPNLSALAVKKFTDMVVSDFYSDYTAEIAKMLMPFCEFPESPSKKFCRTCKCELLESREKTSGYCAECYCYM